MYTEDSDDDNVDYPDDCRQLIPRQTLSMSRDLEDEIDSQFLTDEIDEAGLKMFCLDRINLIKEDMQDPLLTPGERLINQTNLTALNNILTNIRLSEKIKLGALQNSQYTDAVILQKQVVCNLAGQKEYSDIIRPVIFTQPESQNESAAELRLPVTNSELPEIKSILKTSGKTKTNALPAT